jgi:hypothetical protein
MADELGEWAARSFAMRTGPLERETVLNLCVQAIETLVEVEYKVPTAVGLKVAFPTPAGPRPSGSIVISLSDPGGIPNTGFVQVFLHQDSWAHFPADDFRARAEALVAEKIASLDDSRNVSTKVFVSYRRDDSADITGRITDRLFQSLGNDFVFKDVDSIPIGRDFRVYINDAVQQCDVLLAVIGPAWASQATPDGKRRLFQSNDFVRLEVAAALERDIPVVPVLVGGASIPARRSLPKVLQPLIYRNAIEVRRDPDFHSDIERLVRKIKDIRPA